MCTANFRDRILCMEYEPRSTAHPMAHISYIEIMCINHYPYLKASYLLKEKITFNLLNFMGLVNNVIPSLSQSWGEAPLCRS